MSWQMPPKFVTDVRSTRPSTPLGKLLPRGSMAPVSSRAKGIVCPGDHSPPLPHGEAQSHLLELLPLLSLASPFAVSSPKVFPSKDNKLGPNS